MPVLAHHLGYSTAEIPVSHRPRGNGRSRYGPERYVRGFLDLLTVAFMGRYRYRPLHLFGGIGLLLGGSGFLILLYLTVLKLGGTGIGGRRPLLMLGILLVPFAVTAVLAAATKEEIGLAVGCLGIWYAVSHGRRLVGAAIFALGLAATLVDFFLVIPHSATNEFGGYLSDRSVLYTFPHVGRARWAIVDSGDPAYSSYDYRVIGRLRQRGWRVAYASHGVEVLRDP